MDISRVSSKPYNEFIRQRHGSAGQKEGDKFVFNGCRGKCESFNTKGYDIRKITITIPPKGKVFVTLKMSDATTRKIHFENVEAVQAKGRVYIDKNGNIAVAIKDVSGNKSPANKKAFETRRELSYLERTKAKTDKSIFRGGQSSGFVLHQPSIQDPNSLTPMEGGSSNILYGADAFGNNIPIKAKEDDQFNARGLNADSYDYNDESGGITDDMDSDRTDPRQQNVTAQSDIDPSLSIKRRGSI